MDVKEHWEAIHGANTQNSVSWYCPHLETSLKYIEHTRAGNEAELIDIGGGQSSLAADLLTQGYRNVTVLEISAAALEKAQAQLGESAQRIRWIDANVTQAELPEYAYDIWHDRAVFHFLTRQADRSAYVRQAARSLKPDGNLILATFAANGPRQCSGLAVVRYSAESLERELGSRFRLVENSEELHRTPGGRIQPFIYCRFQTI
jgi:2-polyprenyl-3-methyl-5-hydroxy-6-metoxy-1,4-benzoquinol methylase